MSDSYYGQPVLKQPVWTWEIPGYFFAGGLAGASSVVAAAARLTGQTDLADRAGAVAAGGSLLSPALLIADLGRPERFHHMLRVFRPTSPMNMGSWLLGVYAPAAVGSWLLRRLGVASPLARLAEVAAGLLGPAMTTYTAVLVADTAVPAWHEARRELPWVFAGGSAASAGAVLFLLTDGSPAARRLVAAGTLGKLAASAMMEKRLGELAEPYRQGEARWWVWASRVCGLGGLALLAVPGRLPRRIGAALALAGTLTERWSIFRAGFDSAEDPRFTVEPQRARAGE